MHVKLQDVLIEPANMETRTATMERNALSTLAIMKEDVSTPTSNLRDAHLKHNARLLKTAQTTPRFTNANQDA